MKSKKLCRDILESKYYRRFLKNHKKTASINQYRRLFLHIIEDFLKGKLSSQEFSLMAGDIFFVFRSPEFFEKRDPQLAKALHYAADLDYYLDSQRLKQYPHLKQIKDSFLQEIKNYFNEHKDNLPT